MRYEVWLSGYVTSGGSAPAFQLVNPEGDGLWGAETFPEACMLAMNTLGWEVERYYDKESNYFWGCRFFHNNAHIKKSFVKIF
jgi:hypothetical protein